MNYIIFEWLIPSLQIISGKLRLSGTSLGLNPGNGFPFLFPLTPIIRNFILSGSGKLWEMLLKYSMLLNNIMFSFHYFIYYKFILRDIITFPYVPKIIWFWPVKNRLAISEHKTLSWRSDEGNMRGDSCSPDWSTSLNDEEE